MKGEYHDDIIMVPRTIIGIVWISVLSACYTVCIILWYFESVKYDKRRNNKRNVQNNININHNQLKQLKELKDASSKNDHFVPTIPTNTIDINNEEDISTKNISMNESTNVSIKNISNENLFEIPKNISNTSLNNEKTVFNPMITSNIKKSQKYQINFRNYIGYPSLFTNISDFSLLSTNSYDQLHPLYLNKSFDIILQLLNQKLNEHLSLNDLNSNLSDFQWISFHGIDLNYQSNYLSIIDILQINNNSNNKANKKLLIGLDLHQCNLSTNQTIELIKAFINNIYNITIIKLDISNNQIDESIFIELSDWLMSSQCLLEEVSFANIKLEEKGIINLSNWIRQSQSLRRIDISHCNIDRLGCFFISSSISNLPFDNKVQQLIESTYLSIDISSYISNYNNQPINTDLTYLNLSYNFISTNGGIDLANSLNVCINLTYLDISYQIKNKKIGPIGTREFANTLRLNKSNLEVLKLARNEICFEGCRHLASSLLSNDKLIELDIGNVNYITIAGAMQLAQSIRYKPNNRLAWLTVGQYRLPVSVLLGDKFIANKYLDNLDKVMKIKKIKHKEKVNKGIDLDTPLNDNLTNKNIEPIDRPIDGYVDSSSYEAILKSEDREFDERTETSIVIKPKEKSISWLNNKPDSKSIVIESDTYDDNQIKKDIDKEVETPRSTALRRLTQFQHIATGFGKDLVSNISELVHQVNSNIISPIKTFLPIDLDHHSEFDIIKAIVYDSSYYSIYPTTLSIECINNWMKNNNDSLFTTQSLHGMNDELAIVVGILLQSNYNLLHLKLNSYYIPVQLLKGNKILHPQLKQIDRYIDLSSKELISSDMIVTSMLLQDNITDYLCINVCNNNFADTEGENFLVSTLESNPSIKLDYNIWPPHLMFKDGYKTLASLHGLSASGVSIEPQRLEGWFYQGLTIVSTILFYINIISDILSIQAFVNSPKIYHKTWVVIAIILFILPTVLYGFNTIRNLIRYSIKETIIQTLIVLFQLINLFQCYECVNMSMETTAYLDYKYVIGIYKSIPQTLLKSYIMFRVIHIEVNIWVVTSIFLSVISITVIFIMLYDRKMARKLSMAPIIDQPLTAIAVAKLLSVSLGMGKDTEHVESFTNFDSFYTSHYVWAYIYQLLSLFSRIVSLSWLLARTNPNYQILILFLCVYIRFMLLMILDSNGFWKRSLFNNIIMSLSLVISDTVWINNRELTNDMLDIMYYRYIYLSLAILTSIEIMISITFTLYIQTNIFYIYNLYIFYIVLISLILRWMVIFTWKLNIHFPELYNKSTNRYINRKKIKQIDNLSDTNVIEEAVELSKQTIEWTADKLNRISFGWIPKVTYSSIDHDDNIN